MTIKDSVKQWLNKLPHVRSLYAENITWKKYSRVPPGHFYSPVVNYEELTGRASKIWKEQESQELNGINLNSENQTLLLNSFKEYYTELPFTAEKQTHLRYYFENSYYSYTDGIVLYSMMRKFQPATIIEVGSGFSSALMMDVNQLFFKSEIQLKFIEPYPSRLINLIGSTPPSHVSVLQENVQDIPISFFKGLKANDILFIDSTHIVKTGSDVNYLLFEILPVLPKGVFVHIHDIFYPFEYPKAWVFGGRNWNETYFLRSFLMYNNQFEIILFSDYMHRFHRESFGDLPLAYKNTGGNLWIRKC